MSDAANNSGKQRGRPFKSGMSGNPHGRPKGYRNKRTQASTARVFAEIGGLMSFGADGPASFRHGAKFVQRILQGKQPKDIPIEQPTKFDLTINLKTAKAIGLTIPERFLQRADALLD